MLLGRCLCMLVSTLKPEFDQSTSASVLRCLQARYMADTFYTNAGCTLVALNPFKPVPQLYSPDLMKEYHAAPQPQVRLSRFLASGLPYRPLGLLAASLSLSIYASAMLVPQPCPPGARGIWGTQQLCKVRGKYLFN